MMKERSVLLSFIIPVYNGQDTIKDTLDSIFNQKSELAFEVITVNDGSKDQSLEVLQEYALMHPIQIVSIDNSGVSVARNKGLSLSKGKYVYFLDCDDKIDESFFSTITPLLKQNPQMICGRYCRTDGVKKEYRLSLYDGIKGLYKFLKEMKPYYELVSFSNESKYSSEPIINIIEEKKKYFDYNLYREHSFLYGKEFLKDISRIGRDMKKIIIVDNTEQNFRLNKKNGIKIKPFYGDQNDKVLYELSKILVMIVKQGYDDLTMALKDYSNEIKVKITIDN